jgi:hypothetical protein
MKLKRSKLVVYNAEVKNIDGIVALSADVYGKTNAYTDDLMVKLSAIVQLLLLMKKKF